MMRITTRVTISDIIVGFKNENILVAMLCLNAILLTPRMYSGAWCTLLQGIMLGVMFDANRCYKFLDEILKEWQGGK